MLFWLQTTAVRWAIEILVQQLVMQVLARTIGNTPPPPAFAPRRSETAQLCHECGRRLGRKSQSVARRRPRPTKRRSRELPATPAALTAL